MYVSTRPIPRCDHGDPCVPAACDTGVCTDAAALTCADDGNPCTDETACDPDLVLGCGAPVAVGEPCVDLDPNDCSEALRRLGKRLGKRIE